MMMLSVAIIAALVSVSHVEGAFFTLDVVEDVTIHGSQNWDGQNILRVGNNGGVSRALLKFQDLPSACGTVQSAILNIYYKEGPVNPARTLKVHKVIQEWVEDEATAIVSSAGVDWNLQNVGLDGIDADSTGYPTNGVLFNSNRNSAYVPFDITDIVKSWDNGTSPQRGIVIRAINDGVGGSVARFYSRDSSNPNHPAYIQVVCN